MLVLIIDSRWNQEIYRGVQFGQVFASKHFSLFVRIISASTGSSSRFQLPVRLVSHLKKSSRASHGSEKIL